MKSLPCSVENTLFQFLIFTQFLSPNIYLAVLLSSFRHLVFLITALSKIQVSLSGTPDTLISEMEMRVPRLRVKSGFNLTDTL